LTRCRYSAALVQLHSWWNLIQDVKQNEGAAYIVRFVILVYQLTV